MPTENIPAGYCHCGCGQRSPLAPRNRYGQGHIKGEPMPYVHGHNRRKPLAERFWPRVDKRGPDDCWEWKGGRSADKWAYGYFGDGPEKYAHRMSYEMHNGPIPDGMFICHSCDNPPCVNPAHLFAGTHQDNMDDMVAKGRRRRD